MAQCDGCMIDAHDVCLWCPELTWSLEYVQMKPRACLGLEQSQPDIMRKSEKFWAAKGSLRPLQKFATEPVVDTIPQAPM